MNKRCTNPSCRKTFSTLYFSGSCPHCGKNYPQISSVGRKEFSWTVRIHDCADNRIKVIKLIRRTFKTTGLKEALEITKRCPNVLFMLNRKDFSPFVQTLNEYDIPYKKVRTFCRESKILFPAP